MPAFEPGCYRILRQGKRLADLPECSKFCAERMVRYYASHWPELGPYTWEPVTDQ